MTECTEGQQGSAASWNQHTYNSLSPQSDGSPCYGNQGPPLPRPCRGCLQPHRSGSLKWEFSISLALSFSRRWKRDLPSALCWLPFQHFLILVSHPHPRENWYIFHLEIHQNSSQSNSQGRSLAHLFAFILALTTLFEAKLFPLVSTSSFPIGSNTKSLVCQCNNFLLIMKEES